MSKFTNAIKKAAVALQMTAMGHENPAPVEGTQAATMVPAAPSEDRDLAEAKTNAAKVITQLERTAPHEDEKKYDLDAETRKRITAGLNQFGPPRDSWTDINFPKRPKPKLELPDRVDTDITKVINS